MSRRVRKKLFETLELLEDANTTILQFFGTDSEALLAFLEDCQQCAIAIGNQIELLYNAHPASIHALEAYCEAIYQLAQHMDEPGEYYQSLCASLEQVRIEMEQGLPDRLEAVFLPYKADMWDSLESIWVAANEDAGCDIYVVPIPYYDKNPDGSFRTEHYDGELFPDYVPIVGYNDYNLELRQPDIIFIHNPYDAGNHVTSVHPHFYSKNLKQYTDKLVYVPYFVLDGNGVPEHLVLTTGVLNADYVIVQNEKEKHDYIRHFHNAYPQLQMDDKFLPLGSPKLDKVGGGEDIDARVPKEWLEKRQDKKVMFYNTSITSLLEGKAAYLDKVENVFQFFQKRNDVVLLWRPHPLLESTLESMLPELVSRYRELKELYVEWEIGILDESSDMHLAIEFSDAYYGDNSSVVEVYKQTGKPVMIQDIEVIME